MQAPEKNRDLSQLSALLAGHTRSPASSPAPKLKKVRVAPANDNKPVADHLAWPTLERLAHRGDYARLFALRHWKNLMFPGSAIEAAPQGEDLAVETRTEQRPSEGELLTAIGWEITGRERWNVTNELVNTYESQPSAETRAINRNGGVDTSVGSLLFRDGKLVQWGETRKGAPLKPVERPRSPKGSANPGRSDSAVWSYLRLLGATSPLAATAYTKPMSGEAAIGNCYEPLPREEPTKRDKHGRFGVEEARSLLRGFGVDGGTPFEHLPFPATRAPDGLIGGDQWVGGVKKPKPLGEISSSAGREPEIVRHIETMSYVTHLRRLLKSHAAVLDLAITDAAAKEIGVATGLAPAYAEKRGPGLIDAAIDALIALDETARDEPVVNKLAA